MSSVARSSMISCKGHSLCALGARFYLGWIFLTACWHKIAHPDSFALDVATYQLLPLYAVNTFAVIVPWLELLVGMLLVLGYRVRAAALLITLLMMSFIAALVWALHLGLDMTCGCFASQAAATEDTISWRTLVRDLAWLALGLYVLIFDRNPIGIQRVISRKVT